MSSDDSTSGRRGWGGIVHTYLGYDPKQFPSPTQPPPNLVSGVFDHLLMYGSMEDLTEEQLANAVRLDPTQIQGLGPSLDSLIAMLMQRKAKILATYETNSVQKLARKSYFDQAASLQPPPKLVARYQRDVAAEQLRDLERLWYRSGDEQSPFARGLLGVMERLAEKYQVQKLIAKYTFTGRTPMDVPLALQIKDELETIDELLEQLQEARQTAQVGLIDMEALSEFAEQADIDQLRGFGRQVADYLRELAEQQGLMQTRDGFQLTPKAYRLFQSHLLTEIFSDLQAARSGRHSGPIIGEGSIEMTQTRPYQFGDSVVHMDTTQSLINAMIRTAAEGRPNEPLSLHGRDIEIHQTRNSPKCATALIIDMSGSMRHGGQYIYGKRMALALDGLIRSEYPGDFLQCIEMYTFAKPRHISELPTLLPKPVTIYDPMVRLRADMSDPNITEMDIPPHFTNIQHSLQLARQFLANQDTPNRQIVLITDGLPTAHFEGEQLLMLYPPDSRTEEATMREAHQCAREGITINIFLVPSWSQTQEDVQFAQRMVEATSGRVFFTGGSDLDRFVVWDYVQQRRRIIG